MRPHAKPGSASGYSGWRVVRPDGFSPERLSPVQRAELFTGLACMTFVLPDDDCDALAEHFIRMTSLHDPNADAPISDVDFVMRSLLRIVKNGREHDGETRAKALNAVNLIYQAYVRGPEWDDPALLMAEALVYLSNIESYERRRALGWSNEHNPNASRFENDLATVMPRSRATFLACMLEKSPDDQVYFPPMLVSAHPLGPYVQHDEWPRVREAVRVKASTIPGLTPAKPYRRTMTRHHTSAVAREYMMRAMADWIPALDGAHPIVHDLAVTTWRAHSGDLAHGEHREIIRRFVAYGVKDVSALADISGAGRAEVRRIIKTLEQVDDEVTRAKTPVPHEGPDVP